MTYIKKEIFAVLHDIAKKPISEKKKYYEMLKFIHKKANDREIEFSKDLQAQFDVEYKIIKFDHTYFEYGEYKPLYVCLAALADREIYAWLREAYNMTHNEEFSDEILKNEKLRFEKESGPLLMFSYDISDNDEKALIYAKKTYTTEKGNLYDIDHIYTKALEDDKLEVKFVIEYDKYEIFTVILNNDQACQLAQTYPDPKSSDMLFSLAEEKLKNEISKWIDDIH